MQRTFLRANRQYQFRSFVNSSMTPEARLLNLGYDINKIPLSQPKGSYVSAVQSGSLLHLAGHLPYNPNDGEAAVGKVFDLSLHIVT